MLYDAIWEEEDRWSVFRRKEAVRMDEGTNKPGEVGVYLRKLYVPFLRSRQSGL